MLVLDAGALIAFERNARLTVGLIARLLERGEPMAVPAGVVAQVWRDGRRQARLSRLLGAAEVEVVAFDDMGARAAGQLLGIAGTTDVVDASVVLLARVLGAAVATSDPEDLLRLDPAVRLITC